MKYIITVNGEKYEVEVERARRGAGSLMRRSSERREEPVEVKPVEEKIIKTEEKVVKAKEPVVEQASSGENAVVSPMPGMILDIKVNVGDKIAEGDTVLILEAMKMENEIVSEFTGTVAAIKVKKGDSVDTDQVLIEIK